MNVKLVRQIKLESVTKIDYRVNNRHRLSIKAKMTLHRASCSLETNQLSLSSIEMCQTLAPHREIPATFQTFPK